jgi:hypothetical protein
VSTRKGTSLEEKERAADRFLVETACGPFALPLLLKRARFMFEIHDNQVFRRSGIIDMKREGVHPIGRTRGHGFGHITLARKILPRSRSRQTLGTVRPEVWRLRLQRNGTFFRAGVISAGISFTPSVPHTTLPACCQCTSARKHTQRRSRKQKRTVNIKAALPNANYITMILQFFVFV